MKPGTIVKTACGERARVIFIIPGEREIQIQYIDDHNNRTGPYAIVPMDSVTVELLDDPSYHPLSLSKEQKEFLKSLREPNKMRKGKRRFEALVEKISTYEWIWVVLISGCWAVGILGFLQDAVSERIFGLLYTVAVAITATLWGAFIVYGLIVVILYGNNEDLHTMWLRRSIQWPLVLTGSLCGALAGWVLGEIPTWIFGWTQPSYDYYDESTPMWVYGAIVGCLVGAGLASMVWGRVERAIRKR